jgi:hypothetical protein
VKIASKKSLATIKRRKEHGTPRVDLRYSITT